MVAFARNDAILSNYSSTSLCDPSSLSEIPSGTHFSTFYYNLGKKQNNIIPFYSGRSMTLCKSSWGLQLPDSQSFQNYSILLTLPSGTCSRNTTVTSSLRFWNLIPEPTVAARTCEETTFLIGEPVAPATTGKREDDS